MIEQHRHWQQADAVRDGLQSATDPEREDVEVIADGIRLYVARTLGGASIQPCKRLRDGLWVSGVLSRVEADTTDARRDELRVDRAADGPGQLQL